jgi:hypothetical protein
MMRDRFSSSVRALGNCPWGPLVGLVVSGLLGFLINPALELGKFVFHVLGQVHHLIK